MRLSAVTLGRARPFAQRSSQLLARRTLSTLDGSVNTSSADYQVNSDRMLEQLVELRGLTNKALVGGPERAIKLHRSRGQLMPRERIQALLDPGSPFLEFSTLAGHELYGDDYVPAGSLVAGVGIIHGRKVMVFANDPTVKGGAAYPITVKKQNRCQQIAAENRLPCIYLLQAAGANLPLQVGLGSYTTLTLARAHPFRCLPPALSNGAHVQSAAPQSDQVRGRW